MSISKKRIAIVIPGGIGTGPNNMGVPVLERQVKELAKQFDIVVFSLFKVNDGYIPDGFKLIDIPSRNNFVKSLSLFRLFRKEHGVKKFDAIHGFWVLPSGFLIVLLGKLFKIKSIVSVLGGDAIALPEINYGQLRGRLSRKLVIWTLDHATTPIVLTQYLTENLKRYGLNSQPLVIPWGINTELFRYREKPLQQPIQFLHIGNFHPVKDQVTLLRTFDIIRKKIDAHLTIIGTGILEKQIHDLVETLGLHSTVTFVKPVAYEKLPEFYHRADILLHTSLSEGQCEVVTEAMSAGVLVFGTAVGLMFDLPNCCSTVAVKDYEGLANVVLDKIADQRYITETKIMARNWTLRHDIGWTVQQTADIYLC
jgi:glycosyltransferase involved in cell wall biosynthesis